MRSPIKNFLRKHVFWLLLASLFLTWQPVASLIMEHILDEENARILSVIQAQSDATIWSVENAVRLIDGHNPERISYLLKEMARQPGIAWLAIVSETGKIIADNDPSLEGKFLYTESEIRRLDPQNVVKSRFSPDEPTVFESWKLFQSFPEHHSTSKISAIIFSGIDARSDLAALDEYAKQLRLYNMLCQAAFFSLLLLIYFILQFSRSRMGLKDSRALAMQIVGNFPEGLLVADNSGKILLYNRRMAELLRLPYGNFPACAQNLPCLNWEKYMREYDSAGKVVRHACELRFPEGSRKNFVLAVSRIVSGTGKPAGYLFLLHDRSEIARLQKKLELEQRYSAIGKLASGVAHEIRNPLSSMCGYAAFLAEKLNKDAAGRKIALLLVEEGKRLNGVLTEMLMIARKPVLNKRAINLVNLLNKLVLLASADARQKNIDIQLRYSADTTIPHVCRCDADKLLQALLNILLNAISVSGQGDVVEICLDFIQDEPTAADAPFYKIEIKDHGPGIPEALLSQIFNPYFSAKPNGTGLGLTIARQIVDGHDGQILVTSQVGKGATFGVILPFQKVDENEKADSSC